MKQRILFFLAVSLIFSTLTLTTTSCGSNKTGCPINEEAHVQPNKRGKLPKKGGNQQLFSKKARKKMKKS